MKMWGRCATDRGSIDTLQCQWCGTKHDVPRDSVHIPDVICPNKECGRVGYRESASHFVT